MKIRKKWTFTCPAKQSFFYKCSKKIWIIWMKFTLVTMLLSTSVHHLIHSVVWVHIHTRTTDHSHIPMARLWWGHIYMALRFSMLFRDTNREWLCPSFRYYVVQCRNSFLSFFSFIESVNTTNILSLRKIFWWSIF